MFTLSKCVCVAGLYRQVCRQPSFECILTIFSFHEIGQNRILIDCVFTLISMVAKLDLSSFSRTLITTGTCWVKEIVLEMENNLHSLYRLGFLLDDITSCHRASCELQAHIFQRTICIPIFVVTFMCVCVCVWGAFSNIHLDFAVFFASCVLIQRRLVWWSQPDGWHIVQIELMDEQKTMDINVCIQFDTGCWPCIDTKPGYYLRLLEISRYVLGC